MTSALQRSNDYIPHRFTAYDFDRLDSDDVLGNLELDMWRIFDKNWAQEIDKTWALRDDYGDVDKKTLKRAREDKEHVRVCLSSPRSGQVNLAVNRHTSVR